MGVRILEGTEGALFYCSTSDWGFGPLMRDADVAEAFLAYLSGDPRVYKDAELEQYWLKFNSEFLSCGHCGESEISVIASGQPCCVPNFTCVECHWERSLQTGWEPPEVLEAV